MSTPEDLLSKMFEFTGLGKGENVNKMLNTLILNTQINMLKQLRREIDSNIKKLTAESTTTMDYDPNYDPYVILGVAQSATREEIDKAYKDKAWKVHPDRGGSDQDMIMVNAAYEAIRQFRGWK